MKQMSESNDQLKTYKSQSTKSYTPDMSLISLTSYQLSQGQQPCNL